MARKRLTIALLSLFPLCGMLGLLSGCGTIAGLGRDTTNAANWASEKITGSPTGIGSGSTTAATGSSAAESGSTAAAPAAAMTEDQVRRHLRAQGYTHVSNLHPSGSDWVGAAVDNTGKSVNVVVSRSGTILTTP